MWASSRSDCPAIMCPPLAGCKVLVVEGDLLVSMVIEDILADQQSTVIGPFAQVQPALDAVRSVQIDFALLDTSLQGFECRPIAEALSVWAIPFLLLSSYGAEIKPANGPEWPSCSKPFTGSVLVNKMLEELKEGPPKYRAREPSSRRFMRYSSAPVSDRRHGRTGMALK